MKSKSGNKKIGQQYFRELDTEGKIMEIAENFDTPAGKNKEEVLESILGKISQDVPVRRISFFSSVRAVAAVLLLVLGIYTVTNVFSKDKINTKYAEQTELKLPDNSLVVLNAGSKLTYSERTFTKSRELTLKGEAYFDVQKGGQFIISTPNGAIEILGTRLNVFSRGSEFWVSCLEGKVKVSSGSNEQLILPGEMVELSGTNLVKKVKSDIENTAAWKQGTFYFADKPLVSIFEAIERQFNVSVHFQGNPNRMITVTFSNKNLQEALDVICIPMGLKYEIRDNKIYIGEEPS